AFAFGQHSAAAMVHFAFLLALVWQMFGYRPAQAPGPRPLAPGPGFLAAVLVFASPLVGIDATSAYNDVALAAIAFTLFQVLQIWDENRSPRLLAAIGLLAGFAVATKYTGWLAIPYALGSVAWKSRRQRAARSLWPVTLGAALVLGPWLVRNWIWARNPVAPFFNQ